VGDETKNLVDVINLNDSVLDYTKYIQVGMKAIDGNQVVNGKIPLTGSRRNNYPAEQYRRHGGTA
jgi:hypothetical protein